MTGRRGASDWISLKPEAARKLVEGAVRYAADLGFSPHVDYRKAKAIFGDISAESCGEEFRYGKDGQPLFVNGPFDDQARCRHIIRTLTQRLGPDGFRCVLRISELDDILRLTGGDEVLEVSPYSDDIDLDDDDFDDED